MKRMYILLVAVGIVGTTVGQGGAGCALDHTAPPVEQNLGGEEGMVASTTLLMEVISFGQSSQGNTFPEGLLLPLSIH